MTEVTDRNITRAKIADSWSIAWGDLINEWDLITLVVSVPTGSVEVWASQQIDAQLQHFSQSLRDVSDDVVNRAVAYLKELLQHKRSGKRVFDGLGVKAGIATYHRHTRWPGGIKTPLPNNFQPYIGIRVAKPLPGPGTTASAPEFGFDAAVYQEGDPGNGIGGYDLKSSDDQVFPFDYDHSGKMDHLALFRPGTGTIWILKNQSCVFEPVYQEGDPGHGIGGFDLRSKADRVFPFDYDHSGRLDHLAIYRPGTGTIWILKNDSGVFRPVYQEGDPGHGIGGFDLRSSADRVFAFDYDHSGRLDHLTIYRPGTGTIWILKNDSGVFRPVYQEGDPGRGIGGFDLRSSADQVFAFDYNHSGKLDHLAIYRPGTGTIWILKNDSGVFRPVYQEGDPGHGIGGFDLRSKADRVFAFDYENSGKLDHLALYRPGTGTIWILKNDSGVFRAVYQEGDPGDGIGGFDLMSSADRGSVFDYDHSGQQNYLVFYRPGTGTIWILRKL